MKPRGSWLKSNGDLSAEDGRPEAGLCSVLLTPGKKIQSKGEPGNFRLLLNPKAHHWFPAENTPRARAKPYVRVALPGKA